MKKNDNMYKYFLSAQETRMHEFMMNQDMTPDQREILEELHHCIEDAIKEMFKE